MLKPLPNMESLESQYAKVENEEVVLASLKNFKIIKASYCVLFYWHRNRNAWNSTKVSHFYPDSVQTTLTDVKDVVENHRESGNVFFIHTLPTLKLTLEGSIKILITEINTDCPLKGFRLNYSKSSNNYFKITKGSRFLEFYEALQSQKKLPTGLTSALLFMENFSVNPVQVKSKNYQLLKSYSYGPKYQLGWRNINKKLSKSSVLRLVKQINQSKM